MTGIKQFKISNNKVSYDIILKRKISILKGNSGTGKTTLCRMVSQYNRSPKSFKVSGYNKIRTVSEDILVAESMLSVHHDTIFIIDEDMFEGADRNILENAINNSDNYFLIITRERLPSISISCDSIYELEVNKTSHSLKPIYKLTNSTNFKPEQIICEDSGSGFD